MGDKQIFKNILLFQYLRDIRIKKSQFPVGMYISCSSLRQRKATGNSIHRLYQLLLCISKTETKTLEHKHLTLVHTTTVTSRKKHSLRAAFYNSNH